VWTNSLSVCLFRHDLCEQVYCRCSITYAESWGSVVSVLCFMLSSSVCHVGEKWHLQICGITVSLKSDSLLCLHLEVFFSKLSCTQKEQQLTAFQTSTVETNWLCSLQSNEMPNVWVVHVEVKENGNCFLYIYYHAWITISWQFGLFCGSDTMLFSLCLK
jgi:hypothetical protein